VKEEKMDMASVKLDVPGKGLVFNPIFIERHHFI
jgi:hypothetical protein